ncbi:MAG: biosynthetic-type acetolactate synthase large subunit [Spirochaetales bacterium]|nr:biosynthetic-type acetolactate synthase large subunit [Spirochaetales bacterium]
MVINALKKEGVDTVFGFPGGVVIPLFDELYKEPAIKVVLTRHEQGAIHAADGYARATGKTGVCIVTSGPGATNTVTGLATANFDSVPIVCISGQVPTNMIGNDAFQEADTVGITRPVTKHNYIILDRKELPLKLKESFFLAQSGRPGPIIIDIPKDVFTGEADDEYPEDVSILGYNPVYKGHKGQIKKAAQAFSEASKPLFFIGGGVHISGAAPSFKKLAEKTGIPVISSLMGIAAIPSDYPDFLGMLGMHGTYAANMAVSDCDLLIGIGVRFDDRATGDLAKFAPHAKIIHIDIDPSAIARNVTVEVPIVGDARIILEDLITNIEKKDITPWQEQVHTWMKDKPLTTGPTAPRLSPANVIRRISHFFPDAVITTEVGQNQMWAALFYQFKEPRTWITSGGLGTMGYGFPAAIGAQFGRPDRRVIDIAGDGSFQMNSQELATAVHEKLPVIIAILNNGYLGMVRQWQEMFFGRRYSSTDILIDRENNEKDGIGTPDFVKLADAYGAAGFRARTMEEVDDVLQKAMDITDRPIILDFHINYEANVFPMVPPGAGLNEMVLEEDGNE